MSDDILVVSTPTPDIQSVIVEVPAVEIISVGEQGPAGVGIKGDKGDQGIQGLKGDQGIQGVQGLPGSAITGTGDLNYTHQQMSASDTWVVVHNLGKFPSVSVVDSAGSSCEGGIAYDSMNQVTLTFSAAFGGTAYLN